MIYLLLLSFQSSAVVLNWGWFCLLPLPRVHVEMSGTFLIVTTQERGKTTDIYVGVLNAVEYPIMCRTNAYNKELSSPKCQLCWGWETLPLVNMLSLLYLVRKTGSMFQNFLKKKKNLDWNSLMSQPLLKRHFLSFVTEAFSLHFPLFPRSVMLTYLASVLKFS